MTHRTGLATLLLLSSMLVAPAALAQQTGGTSTPTTPPPPTSTPAAGQPQAGQPDVTQAEPGQTAADQAPQEEVEVSAPGADGTGGDIVVVGRNIPNVVRSTSQVVNVLSTADIARTGEGDIAGALTRVTGLSVVGGGFVYVRGLGDRYSSSLLNGSPLPSPEPLRRSVPLDIFPTTIVGSALVQKTYSVNYPGEFGGGIINLTTKAIPTKNFFSVGGSIGGDDFTTDELGYTYYGGDADWIGYDDGTRDVPGFIRNAPTTVGAGGVAGQISADQVLKLSNASTTVLQRNRHIPVNWSAEISGGSVFDIGSDRLGIIASISASNTWRTRSVTQQDVLEADGSALRNDFRTLITDNRAVANALIGVGYEFGENTIRWTNVYVHDTLKQARAAYASNYINPQGDQFVQNTSWFERQLFETQLVGEFRLTDSLRLDGRFAYANSKRKAPYEREFTYYCEDTPDPTNLNARVQPGINGEVICDADANVQGSVTPGVFQMTSRSPFSVIFSDLNEDLFTGQADLSYEVPFDRPFTVSAGYFYSDSDRSSTRLRFVSGLNDAQNAVPGYPYNLYRPDFILSPDIVYNATPLQSGGARNINLYFSTQQGAYAYDASLRVHAGYVQAEAEAFDGLRATIGLRYESGSERVEPLVTGSTQFFNTEINNDYFLPAATLTWNLAENQQLRASASKTLSRPQFRELAPQQFRDPDSDRIFFGNQFLQDSELWNLEARYEWFFKRDQRFTLAGFYKEIDNPIEQVGFFLSTDSRLNTGFTNLPKATLYGGEVELQKYFPLDGLGGDFFSTRRILAIANYTYTKSEITADGTCVPRADAAQVSIGGCSVGFAPASTQFRDGAPLTGQSDHLVNLQLGIEDTDKLSQLTVLFNYASKRVTNRGPFLNGVATPDVYEEPGIRLDVVGRQGITLPGDRQIELKLEARNLTRTKFQEYQTFDNGNRVYANRYIQGRTFSIGLSTTF